MIVIPTMENIRQYLDYEFCKVKCYMVGRLDQPGDSARDGT